MFKKRKISNHIRVIDTRKKTSSLSIFVTIIGIFFIIVIGIWVSNQFSKLKFDLNTLANLAGFDGNFLETDTQNNILKTPDGKTNFLIIWRWWEENDAPELTDSIVIASLNYEKKHISMFSVPRDLYVEYPTGWAWKINETYMRGLKKHNWDVTLAMNELKEVLKKITGEEIHYYANIDFEGFRKVIDSVGWIEVDVPEKVVDTTYPGPNYSYITFQINPGLQTLNGSTALKYARSRHSTSDFDRSLRQQLIIKALKDKFLDIGFISSPSKIKSLYATLNKYVVTDLDISQIITLALYVKDLPRDNIVSSNLNDTCFYGSSVCEKWGFLYVPQRADFGGASVLLQEWGTKSNPSNYDSLIMYTNLVFNYPEIYTQQEQINVFNATKVPGLATDFANYIKKYGFFVPAYNSVGNTWEDTYEKSVILYGSGAKSKTVEALELFIFWGSQQVEILPKYSKDMNNKIEVIIGNDYKLLNF